MWRGATAQPPRPQSRLEVTQLRSSLHGKMGGPARVLNPRGGACRSCEVGPAARARAGSDSRARAKPRIESDAYTVRRRHQRERQIGLRAIMRRRQPASRPPGPARRERLAPIRAASRRKSSLSGSRGPRAGPGGRRDGPPGGRLAGARRASRQQPYQRRPRSAPPARR
jgi:hypothetical protein